jgi:hypothetical protein
MCVESELVQAKQSTRGANEIQRMDGVSVYEPSPARKAQPTQTKHSQYAQFVFGQECDHPSYA